MNVLGLCGTRLEETAARGHRNFTVSLVGTWASKPQKICCKSKWRTPGTCSDQVTALPKDTPGTFTELDLPLASLVWHPAALANEMLVMSLVEKNRDDQKFPMLGQLLPSTLQVLKRPVQSGQAKYMLVAYYYYHCRNGLQKSQ